MADELLDAIVDNASGVAEAAGNGVQVTQHQIKDQVYGHKYRAAVQFTCSPWASCLRARVVMPDAIGPGGRDV